MNLLLVIRTWIVEKVGQNRLNSFGPEAIPHGRKMQCIGHDFPGDGSVHRQKYVAYIQKMYTAIVMQLAQNLIRLRYSAALFIKLLSAWKYTQQEDLCFR